MPIAKRRLLEVESYVACPPFAGTLARLADIGKAGSAPPHRGPILSMLITAAPLFTNPAMY